MNETPQPGTGEKMKSIRQLALNSASNCIRLSVSVVTLVLLIPFILQKVGEEDFGLWVLTFSVMGIFGLLDLGIATSAVKFVASSKGQKDPLLRNRLLGTLGTLYLGIALAAGAGVVILSHFYSSLFSIPLHLQAKATSLLWILAVRTLVLGLPLSLFRGILFGEQRIDLINFIQTISTILYGLIAWICLNRGMGIVELAWINLGIFLVEHLFYILSAYSVTEKLEIRWCSLDRSLLKGALSFSLYAFVPQVANLILLRTDLVIVKLFLPLSAVAIYSMALKISEHAYLFIKQFVNVLTPVVAELSGKDDARGIRRIFLTGTKFILVPAILVGGILTVYASDIIALWVGVKFADAAPILMILSVAIVVAVPQLVASAVLTFSGHPRYTARASIGAALLNVALSVMLAPHLGLMGIAIGTPVSVLFVDLLLVVRQTCRLHGVGYGDYLRQAITPVLLPGIAYWVLLLQLKLQAPPTHWVEVFLQAMAGISLFAVIFWFASMRAWEKQIITDVLICWRERPPQCPSAREPERRRGSNGGHQNAS